MSEGITKSQISEAIFGWGLRNDDGHNLSMDDTDEIAEYIMKQAAQAQSVTKARRSAVNPEAGDYANCVDDMPQAQAQSGERKCSECGNGEPDLSLYCVRCLNNDHWHLIDPAQAGEPVAVADKGVINWLDGKQFDHEADLYTQSAVNQQLLEASRELLESLKAVRELEQPTHTKTGATFKQQIAAWLPVNDASEKLRAAIAAAQEQSQ